MGDKQETPKIPDYYMSIHYGICAGPINALRRLFVGGVRAWRGNITTQRNFVIDETDLFEGEGQEGGVAGVVHFLPGGPTQVLPENLAGRLSDLTSDTCPAFRGISSIFMYGDEGETFGFIPGTDGFYWGSNNPYLKPTSVEVTCIIEDWYGIKAPIPRTIGAPLHEGYTVQVGATANRQEKFDSFGFRNAYAEQFSADIKLYSIPDNTLTTIEAPGDSFVGLHLTVDSLVVSRDSGGDIYFFNLSGGIVSTLTLTLGALGLNFVTLACDIVVGANHYTIIMATDGSGDQQYIRITDHTAFLQTATTDVVPNGDICAGPQYAYVRASTTNVYLVVWPDTPITSSSVAPAGLTAAIANVAYDELTDSVIIVCTNGDLFRYSPDLSTLILSNTATGLGTIVADLNSNKRMCPGDGSIVIAWQESGPDDWHIHVFATSDLIELAHYQSSQQDTWVNPTSLYTFVKYNVEFSSVLMVQHAGAWSQWFFPAADIADMNPAHIIYHSLTNTDWGMATPISNIDEPSFIDAADVLFAEGFGLSMMWSQQATILEFVQDILNHINGTVFVRPSTGLLELKLIRNDYDVGTLPILDRDNSRVLSYARKGWGDTVNEVVISWTNPENEEDETVTLQDLGNITMQGGIVSTSKNYHGIRKPELAQAVAARDITAESWPLATAQVEVNREAWDYVPGECVKLTVDEYGISVLVMRIMTVDYGKPGDSKIKLQLVEDIFALALAEYVDEAPRSLWEDPNEDPRPIDFALPTTLTYFHAKKLGDVSAAEYPEVRAGMLAAQTGNDTKKFKLLGPTVDAGGNETPYDNLGSRTILSRATLVTGFTAEAETIVTSADWTARTQGSGPTAGGFMLIGDGEEIENELALIATVASGSYTLKRGVLDTVPQDWTAATPIWFFSNNSSVSDPITRSALDTISYKVLPITSNGVLPASAASPIPLTLTERPWLPTRPADVTVHGVEFGTADISGESPPLTQIVVTWANRNRITEDTQILAWDAAGVTPEAGQTTNVYVLDENDLSVITAHTGLAGSSFNLPVASFGSEVQAIVRVTSSRDGFESLQGHEIIVTIAMLAAGDGLASGTGTAFGISQATGASIGLAAGVGTASGIGDAASPAIASAAGTGAASGVSPAPFVPTDLGTSVLKAWFDFSDTATITQSGGAVSQVDDKSGNGNHVTQATAGSKPGTGVQTLNGLNVLTFDGGDVLSRDASLDLPHPESGGVTLIALRLVTSGTGAGFVWMVSQGASNGDVASLGRDAGNTGAWGNALATNAGIVADYADSDNTNWHINTAIYTGAARTIYEDGVSKETNSTLADSNTTTALRVGQVLSLNRASNRFLTGRIAQVFVVAGTTTLNFQKLEGWAMHKYNLQSQLDAGHPYKTSPP